MAKPKKRKRERRKRARKREPRQSLHSIMIGEPDDNCPICRCIEREGTIRLIEVSVRGDSTAWPLLPDAPRPMALIDGASLLDLAWSLLFAHPELADNLDPADLVARVNDEFSSFDRVLSDGDAVTFGIARAADHPAIA